MKGPKNFQQRIRKKTMLVNGIWYEVDVNSDNGYKDADCSLWVKLNASVGENVMFIHFDWHNETYQIKFAPIGHGPVFNNIFGLQPLVKRNFSTFEHFIDWLYDRINEHKIYF